MSVSSSLESPIGTIGSIVNVSCIVGFSPAVDVQVAVYIQLTSPSGHLLSMEMALVNHTVNSKASALINSFMKVDSGPYTSTATLNSSQLPNIVMSQTVNISIGKNAIDEQCQE